MLKCAGGLYHKYAGVPGDIKLYCVLYHRYKGVPIDFKLCCVYTTDMWVSRWH